MRSISEEGGAAGWSRQTISAANTRRVRTRLINIELTLPDCHDVTRGNDSGSQFTERGSDAAEDEKLNVLFCWTLAAVTNYNKKC